MSCFRCSLLQLARVTVCHQEIPIPSPIQPGLGTHYSAVGLQNGVTNAQTSKSHFLFPSRYCTEMHGYQVPLFSANPLTKHSFQFNQDNSARWMAPASWVFLGKGQRGNGVFLNKKYSHSPSQVWTKRCCPEHLWAFGPNPTWSETLRVISLCSTPCLEMECLKIMPEALWDRAVYVSALAASVYKWPPYMNGLLHLFFTRSSGTGTCSATSLGKPRRWYLRYTQFCFVDTVFILATMSTSGLGISAKISLWVYVAIFLEDVCHQKISRQWNQSFPQSGKCENLERIMQCNTKGGWYLPENCWFMLPGDRWLRKAKN